MRVHILVEGPADEALLKVWAQRVVPGHRIRVITHEGIGRSTNNPDPAKHRGLLDQLPARLRAYGRSMDPATERVLILVDADSKDCRRRKQQLADVYAAIDPRPVAKIRIAVQETEAFYLGDHAAIVRAWPGADTSYVGQTTPDLDWTWELFQTVIKDHSEAKVRWATTIAPHLGTDPARNRSPSFGAFVTALRWLCGEAPPPVPAARGRAGAPSRGLASPKRAKPRRR